MLIATDIVGHLELLQMAFFIFGAQTHVHARSQKNRRHSNQSLKLNRQDGATGRRRRRTGATVGDRP